MITLYRVTLQVNALENLPCQQSGPTSTHIIYTVIHYIPTGSGSLGVVAFLHRDKPD